MPWPAGWQLVPVLLLLVLSRIGAASDLDPARLLEAAKNDDVTTIRQELAAGVPVNARDERGRTALLLATHHDARDAARVLIDAGADVNARDEIHDSPYLYAGAEGRLVILKMTLKAGADLDSVNRYGGTALIPAAHHGHVETVRYLLQTGIDIDHINFLGWTALLEAIILGDGSETYQRIVELLLAAGADKNIADDAGITPLEHARNGGHRKIAEMLE